MIVMIIIAALFYILAGTLFVSNIYIMLSHDGERERNEAISNKNSKVIGFLLTVGAILGIIWLFYFHIPFLIGAGVLLGAFLIGVFIRIILQKKQSQ